MASSKVWRHRERSSTYVVKSFSCTIVLDNGCKRNVGGSPWHKAMQTRLAQFGLTPIKRDQVEEFQFGSDRIDKSVCSWDYPVGIHNHNGIVNIAEIESNCPGLMSDDTMGQLDISINTGPKTYHVGKFGIWDHKYDRSSSGHALLSLDQFGDLSEFSSSFYAENNDAVLPVRKGTARRLRKAANLVAEVNCTMSESETTAVPSDTEPESCPTDSENTKCEDNDVWPDHVCCLTG